MYHFSVQCVIFYKYLVTMHFCKLAVNFGCHVNRIMQVYISTKVTIMDLYTCFHENDIKTILVTNSEISNIDVILINSLEFSIIFLYYRAISTIWYIYSSIGMETCRSPNGSKTALEVISATLNMYKCSERRLTRDILILRESNGYEKNDSLL